MSSGEQLPEIGSTPQMDPERRLWFDFLSKLNDRSIQEKRESGATGWVLLAAAVGILYRCVPLIPHFLSLPGALRAASAIFLLEVDGLVFLGLTLGLAIHWADEAAPARLEPRTFSRFRRLLLVVLCIGALVLAAGHGWLAARFALPGVTKYALLAFCLLWLANFAYPTVGSWRKSSKAKQWKTTVPEFSGLKIPRQLSGVAAAATLVIGISAVVALLSYLWSLDHSSVDWITPLAAASHFLALLTIVSILSLRRISHSYRGAYLSLERAILVERLSADEIRSRYETEMLGLAVGGWFKTLVDSVRREHADLKAALSSVRERTKDVEAIDPRYGLERIGRAKALADDWDKASSSQLSRLEECNFQLGEARDFPLSPAEEEALSRIRSDWQELLRQAKEEIHSTAAALRSLLALIGSEGADAP